MKKSLKPHWKPYHFSLNVPEVLLPWLLHTGSFMERLKEHGVKHSSIQVLQNAWQLPEAEERKELGLTFRQYALVREVLIRGDDALLMYARTVIPHATVEKNKLLAHLKTRSLGSVLFKDPNLQRSPFQISCLLPGMPLYTKIHDHCKTPAELWARRSVFHFHESRLLLLEAFFPKIFKKLD